MLSIASFTQSNLPPLTNENLEFSLPIMSKLFYGLSVLKTSGHSVLAEVCLSSNHIPVATEFSLVFDQWNGFQSKNLFGLAIICLVKSTIV